MNHNRLKLFNFKWSSILRFKKELTCRHSAKIYNIGYYIDPSSEKMEFYSYNDWRCYCYSKLQLDYF